jgi:hypothetical protein
MDHPKNYQREYLASSAGRAPPTGTPGRFWIYDLPGTLDRHATPNPQAYIQAQFLHSLRAGPFLARSAPTAEFFVVPLPFDGNPAVQGRADAAAVMAYVRHRWPYFNASLLHASPNHLLTFVGDHGPDLVVPAPGRLRVREVPASLRRLNVRLPPELDVASTRRHWVTLMMTGNPEVGYAMRCDAMRCDAMRRDAMRCDAMRCDAMRRDAMRCDAMRCYAGRFPLGS